MSRANSRRAATMVWLRRAHGWIGLWGATLGLLFGLSGIWLNHRALLKLPLVAQQRSTTLLALPDPAPADAQALAAWLQSALRLDAPATSVRTEPSQPVPWAEPTDARSDPAAAAAAAALRQPEHWTIGFGNAASPVQVDAWVGNRSVSVRQTHNGLLATLMNLHKGVGMPVAWVLLVDTLAGSIIVLSLTGLALWMLTHRRRIVGVSIFGAGLAFAAALALGWR